MKISNLIAVIVWVVVMYVCGFYSGIVYWSTKTPSHFPTISHTTDKPGYNVYIADKGPYQCEHVRVSCFNNGGVTRWSMADTTMNWYREDVSYEAQPDEEKIKQ